MHCQPSALTGQGGGHTSSCSARHLQPPALATSMVTLCHLVSYSVLHLYSLLRLQPTKGYFKDYHTLQAPAVGCCTLEAIFPLTSFCIVQSTTQKPAAL